MAIIKSNKFASLLFGNTYQLKVMIALKYKIFSEWTVIKMVPRNKCVGLHINCRSVEFLKVFICYNLINNPPVINLSPEIASRQIASCEPSLKCNDVSIEDTFLPTYIF